MESVKNRMDRLLASYPEAFQVLEEYDRTRKLRKIYSRKRFNITIDENILRDFKAYSDRNGVNMSRLIEKKMLESMRTHNDP
jgi:hypothetical protein